MKKHLSRLTRRRFLQGLGLGAASLSMPWTLRSLPAIAGIGEPAPGDSDFLIVCSFDGGWDQLLAFDPRDDQAFNASNGATIISDYAALASTSGEAEFQNFMQDNPSGVTQAGDLTFGPAARALAPWADRMALLRGINMKTLTHAVGTRYFLTGKFPSGLAAKGSALPTWMTHELGAEVGASNLPPIPNLAVGVETYNDGLAGYASGLRVSSAEDLRGVLYSFNPLLSEAESNAIEAYFEKGDSDKLGECAHALYNGSGSVDAFMESREAAKVLASGELETFFNFTKNNTQNEDLYAHFGLMDLNGGAFNQATRGGLGQAMIAAQALSRGVSQCVSVSLASGIDHHDEDYGTLHYGQLKTGFDALERLIAYLDVQGILNRTTILVTSEFARTPVRNARGGRDHHLTNSAMVMGPGIAGGQVLGSTSDTTWVGEPINVSTGAPDPGGHVFNPTDIVATVLNSVGKSYEYLDNQDPIVLSRLQSSPT